MTGDDELDVECLARGVSDRFDRRAVEIAPFAELDYEPSSWQDAIVFVRAGTIAIDCVGGECARFRDGDIICLAPFSVRVVRNPHTEPAHLLVVSRRTG
jgi:quercetin dioxygenase-like cupin family protein